MLNQTYYRVLLYQQIEDTKTYLWINSMKFSKTFQEDAMHSHFQPSLTRTSSCRCAGWSTRSLLRTAVLHATYRITARAVTFVQSLGDDWTTWRQLYINQICSLHAFRTDDLSPPSKEWWMLGILSDGLRVQTSPVPTQVLLAAIHYFKRGIAWTTRPAPRWVWLHQIEAGKHDSPMCHTQSMAAELQH